MAFSVTNTNYEGMDLSTCSLARVAALFSDQFVNLCKLNDFRNVGIVITGGNVNIGDTGMEIESK